MSCYTTGNTGQQYCTTEAIFGDPIGIILALDGTNNEFSVPLTSYLKPLGRLVSMQDDYSQLWG